MSTSTHKTCSIHTRSIAQFSLFGAAFLGITSIVAAAPVALAPSHPAVSTQTSPGVVLAAATNCVTNVWSNLGACGWAGKGNTGFRRGTTLRTTAARTITVDGTVIDSEKIVGGLVISAKNVTVKNSWIIKNAGGGSGNGVINVTPGSSARLVRNVLDGSNATHAGIWYEGAKLFASGNEIIRVNDGIFVWDANNFTIEDNYLHSFTTDAGNGHVDGFQTEGASNGIIRHNTIDVSQDQTSAIAIWNGRRNSSNILVANNLLAGGGFAIYAQDYHPSEASPAGGFTVTNVRFENNMFSKKHYPCVGYWGVWFPRGAPTDGWIRRGNKVLETSESIDNKNPSVGGVLCN